jgi:hypothetical protein
VISGRRLRGPKLDERDEYRLTSMSKDERCNLVIDRIFLYRPVSTQSGHA